MTDDVKVWELRLAGDGKTAVPGRIAEVIYGGEPVRGVDADGFVDSLADLAAA